MVLECDGTPVGAVVDHVVEVLRVAAARIAPPPPVVRGLAAAYIQASSRCPGAPSSSSRRRASSPRRSVSRSTRAARSRRMADDVVRALRDRHDQISGLLDRAQAPADLDAAKRDIIAFFKYVDGLVTELAALKEEIRALVDRYKQMAAESRGTAAPEFPAEKLVVQADHIGASTYIQKGWSLLSLGDYQGAIHNLTRALELSPNEIEAESLLGWAQMLGEDYDAALGTFQKVLMREPANSLARINVGYICYKKRIFGEAIEHLSKAIRIANDKKATLYAHYYLGLVYLEREMFEDAESFFRKTIDLGPNMTEAFFEMGRAQWYAGNEDGAKETWHSAVAASKLSPGGKKCAAVLELVAAGGAPPPPGAGA